jgi:hypothetical protein
MIQELKVVLLDDDTDRAKAWAEQISRFDNCVAVAPEKNEVRELIGALFKRRKEGRVNGAKFWDVNCELVDGADLLIIDYDLQNLDDNGEWTTGSEVAYSARLVSKAKTIVVINQRGANRFDLTMVKAAESRADLDIGGVQLTNPGLWQSSGFQGYRPWHWPNLTLEPARALEGVAFVRAHLDASIFTSLGFSEDFESGRALRPEVWGKLCVEQKTTFRELVAPADEAQSMHLLFADVSIFRGDDELTATIAAAITRRWLEKWVLPNQDVLSDSAHLALRMPWIIANNQDEKEWHKLETLESCDGLVQGLGEFMFKPSCLFSRPVYWAEAIEAQGNSLRPDDFDYTQIPDFVFREDVSNFGRPAESRDFPSQVISIENRRWISDPDSQAEIDGPRNIKAVVFEPQSLLLS